MPSTAWPTCYVGSVKSTMCTASARIVFTLARFQVILNPCFLARLGVSRAEAITWLDWAESLGIYQGWDPTRSSSKATRARPSMRGGSAYSVCVSDASWRSPAMTPISRPRASGTSSRSPTRQRRSRAARRLLPSRRGFAADAGRLRSAQMTGARWARELERLVAEFSMCRRIARRKNQVRAALLAALDKLGSWDALHDSSSKSAGLPLALVREYVHSQLEVLPGNHGEYLTGGVMISALQPMRPLPFPIVYILGMGEDLFPGSNALSSFDLRGAQRMPGDVRPAESRLYDFLATNLAAEQKLYLLYNNHDLQKDQPLLPAVPLQQLQRYLNSHILQNDFQTVSCRRTPMTCVSSTRPSSLPIKTCSCKRGDADRCLALLAARRDQRLSLDAKQEAEWQNKWKQFRIDFNIVPATAETPANVTNVTLGELNASCTARAGIAAAPLARRRSDDQTLEDDEPLVTTQQAANALCGRHRTIGARRRPGKHTTGTRWVARAFHRRLRRLPATLAGAGGSVRRDRSGGNRARPARAHSRAGPDRGFLGASAPA